MIGSLLKLKCSCFHVKILLVIRVTKEKLITSQFTSWRITTISIVSPKFQII